MADAFYGAGILLLGAAIAVTLILDRHRLLDLGALVAVLLFGILCRALIRQSHRLAEQASELARTAEALRHSEERFRDFAVVSSDWLWETDENHRFTFQSDTLPGSQLRRDNRIGKTRREFASDAESEPEKWDAHFALLERREPFRNFIYRRQLPGDCERMLSISGKPVFDASGRFIGYRGTARDVTMEIRGAQSLREAKIAAENANRAKSQFLANMSHELRTPLNAILGFAEMLSSGLAGPTTPHQKEYAEFIHQGGTHLLSVINDILDLVRVDAGRLELREERGVDPRRVSDASLAFVKERAAAGAVTLGFETDEAVPMLIADPTRLTQILINLLTNAIKFTEAGGSASLCVRNAAGGGVTFAVSDTGAGMAPREIEIALEPFGQVDSSLARRHEGAGLGLPLARRLAELHGAAFQVASEKGRGTTVSITLPASRTIMPAPRDRPSEETLLGAHG